MQRVGVVGAGTMGTFHSSAYARMPNAELVAVADIRPEVAANLAGQYGAKSFSSVYEMLDGIDLDVVDVCVPTPWHVECIKAAAKCGKHVTSEKPLARTLDGCREAIEACKDAGVKFFVAHVLRYFPEFVKMREIVKSGMIGNPATVRTTRGGGYPRAWENWYGNIEWSGGLTLDMIIHDFDWILWTFGPAERVFAKGLAFSGLEGIEYSLVTIRLKNGIIAHVEGTWAMPSGFNVKVEVAGDGGLLNFDSRNAIPLVINRKATEGAAGGVAVPESPLAESPYYTELSRFIDCLETGVEPEVSPEEAMNAVEIGLAALESMKTGKPVSVSGGRA